MSPSRLLLVLLGVAALSVTAYLFLGGHEPAGKAAAIGAQPHLEPTETSKAEESLRIPVDEGRAERGNSVVAVESPQLDAPPPPTATGRTLPLKKVDVFALTTTGESLMDAASDALGGLQLSAAVAVQPFGEWVEQRRDLFERGEGAGRVESIHNERGQIARVALLADPPLEVALTLGPKVLATRALNPKMERVEFRLDIAQLAQALGSLRFQVVDKDSQAPIAEASVLVQAEVPMEFRSLSTDAEGFVVLDPWFVGPTQVSVYGPESGWVRFELETDPGAPTDAGRIPLARGVEVEGQVVDSQGRAMASVQVQARLKGWSMPRYLASSDPEGLFRYTLTEGTWIFEAYPSGGDAERAFPQLELEIHSGQAPPPVRLQLVPAAPLVLQATDPWARRATFRVAVHGGNVVRAGNLVQEPSWRDVLPLGGYDVELIGPDGEVLQRVEVAHGELGTRIILDRL